MFPGQLQAFRIGAQDPPLFAPQDDAENIRIDDDFEIPFLDCYASSSVLPRQEWHSRPDDETVDPARLQLCIQDTSMGSSSELAMSPRL